MRIVTYTDKHGRRHRAAVPNHLPDEQAPYGLKLDPPNLDHLDWAGLQTDIHNALVDLGIANWHDWQKQQHAVQGAILRPLVRRLVAHLRSSEEG
jgi:hypothetical protein